MLQLDPLNTGVINEDQFVTNVLNNYDEYELSEILIVDLIPAEGVGLEELNMHSRKDISINNSNKRFDKRANQVGKTQ